jgi:hypothetical protein
MSRAREAYRVGPFVRPPNVLIVSDQGGQYASRREESRLRPRGIALA